MRLREYARLIDCPEKEGERLKFKKGLWVLLVVPTHRPERGSCHRCFGDGPAYLLLDHAQRHRFLDCQAEERPKYSGPLLESSRICKLLSHPISRMPTDEIQSAFVRP